MAHLDIWSDVACPWCFIGKRRLDKALAALPEDQRPTIRWRAYQLMPDFPEAEATPARAMLEKKFGGPARVAQMLARVGAIAADEGIHFNVDAQLACNTGLAHRAVTIARAHGREGAAVEALFSAYFERGSNLADAQTVTSLLADVLDGLGVERSSLQDALVAGQGADEVMADRREAAELGVNGVPFFVLDEQVAMSGAQDPETFAAFLRSVPQR